MCQKVPLFCYLHCLVLKQLRVVNFVKDLQENPVKTYTLKSPPKPSEIST